jgi:type VI protein secretion system component VasK
MFESVATKYATLGLHTGRRTVIVATAVTAAAFLYVLLHRHDDAYAAFTRALLAGGSTMVVLGVAERFWRGAKVKKAGMSETGPILEFEDHIARAVAEINERMNEQIATINDRLFDVEKVVFKEADDDADVEE